MYVGYVFFEVFEILVIVVLENVGGGSFNVVLVVCEIMDFYFWDCVFDIDIV